ncbi:MAG: PEP-CTERM sorting domain-containing protein [Betaproteobacteria bacterium]|nr:PEP-CTERM sorting domain-containing protein [Betaproteobacteria bacterium]
MKKIAAGTAGVVLALVVGAAPATAASSFDQMFVFGDSLSDNGNLFQMTQVIPGLGLPPSPPYAQRLSNGPVAAEHLAAMFGITLAPSLSGGTDYAVAGAATSTYTAPYEPSPPLTPPSSTVTVSNYIPTKYWPVDGVVNVSVTADKGMQWEVDQFKAAAPAFNPNSSLFMVWGGANDFFLLPGLVSIASDPQATALATAGGAAAQIGSFVSQLYDSGARNFLVPNLPNVANIPGFATLSPTDKQVLTDLTQYFNVNLAGQLVALSAAHPDMNIIGFDTYTAFESVLANPAAFGLTNVTDACLASVTATPCAQPDSYLFWDDAHPTTRGAQIIADALYGRVQAAMVPEPGTWALMVAGLSLVGWSASRRVRGGRAAVTAV